MMHTVQEAFALYRRHVGLEGSTMQLCKGKDHSKAQDRGRHLWLPVGDFHASAVKAHYAYMFALILRGVCCSEDVLCFGFHLLLYLVHVQVSRHFAVSVPPQGKVS